MDNNAIIQIKNLTKIYKGRSSEVKALDGIDLTIHRGDIFGIIGMSGAGKSTLVRCMNLLERPTSGEILFNGINLATLNDQNLRLARQEIGMIFQQFNLLMQRTVEKNILFPMEIAGIDHATAKKRVDELLKIVDLSDKKHAYPAQLSGGQKQRVAIARALATNPKVLLCDEATSALDPKTTRSILSLLKDINQRLRITIVIITHEMSVIEEICSHVAIIDQSKIAE
ncbi:MAG: ATP-binding cassette domain-containing protein, partial [Anaerovorax sp.]|nr:ATP-binding cassette domain-containing protein [Anaerovorax sp.]